MGGKATIFLVLGFAIIFGIAQRNYTNMATATTQKLAKYYYVTKVRAAASASVNKFANRLFFRASAVDTISNTTYDGVTVSDTIKTIDAYQNIRKIVSKASIELPHSIFEPESDWKFVQTTKIIVKPSLFSKYGYFSHNEGSGIYWSGRDSIWGPFHTNGNIQFNGNTMFYGLATVGGTVSLNGYNPQFLGGLSRNVSITIPPNGVSNVQTNSAGGAKFTGKPLIFLEFRGDSIRYRFSTSGAWTYKLLSTWTPNGVISCENAEVHVKGVVKGKYSVAVSGTSSTAAGNIYLDDDIVYNTNPKTNPTSKDLLGLIAQKNVIVTDNTANQTNINIHAAIYAQEGSFTVQNYSSGSPRGTIFLQGGITQYTRGAVGTGSGSTVSSGFAKSYRYDERLLVSYPPFYPGCGTYEVISWFE